MAIVKPPKKAPPSTKAMDDYIAGAPDAAKAEVTPAKRERFKVGKKLQITLTITPDLLEQVDALASKLGQTRAAVINLAIYQGLESGLSVNK